MDFMKKITDLSKKAAAGVTDTYKMVSDKTGDIVKETKSKFNISDKKDEVSEIYLNIGKTVYEMYKKDEEVGQIFTKECKKIDKTLKEIKEIEKTILFNKNLRNCNNCSEIIPLESAFCEHCGAKQNKVKIKEEAITTEKEEIKPEKIAVDRVCPECGMVMDISSEFCRKCGHKF